MIFGNVCIRKEFIMLGCKVTMEMSAEAAKKLTEGFKNKDPKLMALIRECGCGDIIDIQKR